MKALKRSVLPTIVAGVLTVTLTACTSSGSGAGSGTPNTDPAGLLKQAKSNVDSAQTVHVNLTTSGAAGQLHAVDGSLKRPNEFQGSITVNVAGATVQIPVISTGNKVYAKLPLTSGYSTVNPSSYGVKDPGQLLDTSNGLSSLLTDTKDLKSNGQKRINGEVVDEITGKLPQSDLAGVLPVSGQTGDLNVTYDVVDSSKQLRRAVITGNLAGQGDATYTLTLDHYGDPVTITNPG